MNLLIQGSKFVFCNIIQCSISFTGLEFYLLRFFSKFQTFGTMDARVTTLTTIIEYFSSDESIRIKYYIINENRKGFLLIK